MHKHIKQFAEAKLAEHGLAEKGWIFAWSTATVTLGFCKYNEKMITASSKLVKINSQKENEDTILHEIAHALAGSEAHHGPQWKRIAKRIGATPETTAKDTIELEPKYVVTAGGDEIFIRYQRKPRIKNWSQRWATGRRDETYGKLQVMSYDAYTAKFGEAKV